MFSLNTRTLGVLNTRTLFLFSSENNMVLGHIRCHQQHGEAGLAVQPGCSTPNSVFHNGQIVCLNPQMTSYGSDISVFVPSLFPIRSNRMNFGQEVVEGRGEGRRSKRRRGREEEGGDSSELCFRVLLFTRWLSLHALCPQVFNSSVPSGPQDF